MRDLSLHHNTAQGRPTKLDVTLGYITDSSGNKLHVEEESKDNGWTRSLRIYVPGARDADQTIIIRYRVANAIRFFFASRNEPAFDELYWNVTGNSWTMPIDSVHTRVVLPGGVTPTRTAVYTGVSGSIAADAEIEKTENEVDFTLRRGLSPYEGMTIGVGWAAGHISGRPSESAERLAQAVRWSPLLIPFVVFILAFKSWEKRGRDPKEASYVVRYEPVEGASPAELGTLVDNTADMDDITATLVDLAVHGFIRIEEITESHLLGLSKSTDYILHILRDPSQWTGLKPHEKRYIEKLSELAPIGETSVRVSELRNKFYGALPKIRDAIYDSLVAKGYYLERPDKVQGKWIAFAVFAAVIGGGLFALMTKMMLFVAISPFSLIAAVVASAMILFVFALIMPARTVAGARAREATLGFKEFLGRVESERYEAMITSPQMFERFLAYAMAFGVADKWARAFEAIYREPPTWYVGGTGPFNMSSFSHNISEMSSAVSSSMSSSPSSSGSGGGGSSGGGSGGGGGSGF